MSLLGANVEVASLFSSDYCRRFMFRLFSTTVVVRLACIWRCNGRHGGRAGGVPRDTPRCHSTPGSTCSLATVAKLSSSLDFCTQPHLCHSHRRSLARWSVCTGQLRYEPGQSHEHPVKVQHRRRRKQTMHNYNNYNVERRSFGCADEPPRCRPPPII